MKNKYSKILTKEFLIKEYIENRKSCNEIASIVDCTNTTVSRYLKTHSIKKRLASEVHSNYSTILTKKILYTKYIRERKTIIQIAEKFRCSDTTVLKYLKKYKIKIRVHGTLLKIKYKGKNNPNYNEECHKKHYCKEPNCNNEISYWNWKWGSGRCKHCAMTANMYLLWQDKEYREKILKSIFKGLQPKPNKPEKLLIKLLNKILPTEYKFVGNFKFWIERFNPDFINRNGQKKIIEHYGDFWHNLPKRKLRDKIRLQTYKKYGYKTLIIWEHELKDLDKVKGRILTFNKI